MRVTERMIRVGLLILLLAALALVARPSRDPERSLKSAFSEPIGLRPPFPERKPSFRNFATSVGLKSRTLQSSADIGRTEPSDSQPLLMNWFV